MSNGVLITLIICVTLIILFGIALAGGRQTRKEKELQELLKQPRPPMWGRKD